MFLLYLKLKYSITDYQRNAHESTSRFKSQRTPQEVLFICVMALFKRTLQLSLNLPVLEVISEIPRQSSSTAAQLSHDAPTNPRSPNPLQFLDLTRKPTRFSYRPLNKLSSLSANPNNPSSRLFSQNRLFSPKT